MNGTRGLLPVAIGAMLLAVSANASALQTATSAGFTHFPNPNIPDGAIDVAIVSRGTNQLDLFRTVGAVVYDRFASGWFTPVWLSDPNNGPWCNHIAATLNGTRIDVVCMGDDGHLWHAHSNDQGVFPIIPVPASQWLDMGTDANRGGCNDSSLALTSWEAGRLDLFYLTGGCGGGPANLGHKYAINNQWVGTESGNSPGTTYLQPLGHSSEGVYNDVAAVSWGPGSIQIVWAGAGQNSKLWHGWYDASFGGWGAPETLDPGNTGWGPAQVAISSSAANKLDVFGWSQGNQIKTTQWNAPGVSGWSSVSTVSYPAGSPTPNGLKAALRWNKSGSLDRLDLFGDDGQLYASPGNIWQAYFLNVPL